MSSKVKPYFSRLSLSRDSVLSLSEEQIEAIRRFDEKTKNGTYRMVDVASMSGTTAESSDAVLLATTDRYGLPIATTIDKTSGLVWESRRLDEESLKRFYRDDYRAIYKDWFNPSAALNFTYLEQIRRGLSYFDWIARQDIAPLDSSSVFFDIGCGLGGIVQAFSLAGAGTCIGVDYGKEFLEFGRSKGLTLLEGSLEELESHAPADAIVLSHVLEHVPDVIGFLSKVRELLKDSGVLFVSVPGILNMEAYRNDFRMFLQNAHLHHFCKDTLAAVASRCGLEVIAADEQVRMLLRKNDALEAIPWNPECFERILRDLEKCEEIVEYPDALYPVKVEGRFSRIRVLNRMLDAKNMRLIRFHDRQRELLSKLLKPFRL